MLAHQRRSESSSRSCLTVHLSGWRYLFSTLCSKYYLNAIASYALPTLKDTLSLTYNNNNHNPECSTRIFKKISAIPAKVGY